MLRLAWLRPRQPPLSCTRRAVWSAQTQQPVQIMAYPHQQNHLPTLLWVCNIDYFLSFAPELMCWLVLRLNFNLAVFLVYSWCWGLVLIIPWGLVLQFIVSIVAILQFTSAIHKCNSSITASVAIQKNALSQTCLIELLPNRIWFCKL